MTQMILLLDASCLFQREAKVPSKHFNRKYADLQSCWDFVFSFPQFRATLPMSLPCWGCWAEGHFLSWQVLLPAGDMGCRQCYTDLSGWPRCTATAQSGGGGSCVVVPAQAAVALWLLISRDSQTGTAQWKVRYVLWGDEHKGSTGC